MRVIAKNLTLRLNDAEYSQLRSIANARGLKIEPTIRRLIAEVHTAVSSGSWCGGQRQQCGDSGSGLR